MMVPQPSPTPLLTLVSPSTAHARRRATSSLQRRRAFVRQMHILADPRARQWLQEYAPGPQTQALLALWDWATVWHDDTATPAPRALESAI